LDVTLIKTDSKGDEEWSKTFDREGGTDFGNSVQQTADGGYIITGSAVSQSSSGVDVWLIKVDATGLEEWNNSFGGDSSDVGNSGKQTSDGGYIITGRTESFGAGIDAVWLIKTDALGDTDWTKTFGTSNSSIRAQGMSVQQTLDGGYILAGSDIGNNSDLGGFLIMTDDNGNELWRYELVGASEMFHSVQQTSDGGYIVGGVGDFDTPLLLKTDVNGALMWARLFSLSSTESNLLNFAQQTLDGGYIFIGNTTATAGLLLIKTDALGSEEWNKIFFEGSTAIGYSVQQTLDGGYILTGKNAEDIWLIKTDSEGNTVL